MGENTEEKALRLEKQNGVRSVRTNQEWTDQYTEPDITLEIVKLILRWLGHMDRMPEENTVKVSKNIPHRKRSAVKPRKRWMDNM
jgi:hypothetical protein